MSKVVELATAKLRAIKYLVLSAKWRLVNTPSVFWRRVRFEITFFPIRIYYHLFILLAKYRVAHRRKNVIKNPPRVFDCFTFYDGLDLLEIRFHVLDKYVDFFVIVEATTTHAGKLKPLYFNEKKNRYSQFLHKIRHVIVEDMPEIGDGIDRPYLTSYQRDQIMRGLKDCDPDDIIFVSDFDEIPNPKVLPLASELLSMGFERIRFYQRLYYYYLNGQTEKRWWVFGTVAARFSTMISKFGGRPDKMRPSAIEPEDLSCIRLREGGWHFSYLGGVDAIIRKIDSFEITEMDRSEFKSQQNIINALTQGNDVFGRPNFRISYIKIDHTFPVYVQENQARLHNLIYSHENIEHP